MTEIPADLGRYYATDGYGAGADVMTPDLRRREQAKLSLISRFAGPGPMVEVGPGPGLFTRVAKANGFDITALEMDPHYCTYLRQELGVEVVETDAPEHVLPSLRQSRAVVMWHAIEHVPHPWELLSRSVENLLPGGVLALSTPNPGSLQFRILGRRWTHVDAPRHLQLIPPHALERKLAGLGMRLVLMTTSDPVGKVLNRSGWEAAVRMHPARRPTTMLGLHLARAITFTLSPIERHGLNGAAYTAVFVRGDGPSP
jgi:2-polyprenyl-3-methyl-5-hydroxy-6-metoxy-1,4-benzoquinol methylase